MKDKMEKGQSMVLIIALMFGFLAILALVLDGGILLYMRRNAQNAADAGALAGADNLCKFKNPGTAEGVAESTAFNNGAFTAVSNAIWVDPGGYVEVSTTTNHQSFFAQLFEITSLNPPAYARAGCAPPGEGFGVLPIAWSCRDPDAGEYSESTDCALKYMNGPECTIDDDPMYIIVDTKTIEEDIFCQDPPNSGLPDPTYMDCDIDNVIDGDGNYQNDIAPLSGGNRSWLDLDGGGGGNLADWVTNGFPGTIYPHTWMAGKTGADVSVYNATHDDQLGNVVIIPVFNDFCPSDPNNPVDCPRPDQIHHSVSPPPNPPDPDNPDNREDVIVGETGNVDYFHIVSFSYFYVACVDAGSNPGHGNNCDVHDYLVSQGQIDDNVKTIEGCFVEGYVPSIGGDVGSGIDAGVYTVFLVD
jgi:hypothetical protein